MNQTNRACEESLYGYLFHMLEYTELGFPGDKRKTNCTINVSGIWNYQNSSEVSSVFRTGKSIFSYLTPFILLVGVVGNMVSLSVFLSRTMRALSASTYLAAISLADLLTLIVYVQVEWLRRGLGYLNPHIDLSFLDTNGICHVQLYLSYVSRFLSTWLVVAFTLERYIGVCHPLRRRDICTTRGTRKLIGTIIALALVISLYKPLLSGVYVGGNGVPYCTSNPEYGLISFILDSVFGLLITFFPFVIITVLNMFIMKKLFMWRYSPIMRKVTHYVTGIKLEFTVILLGISFCFVAFNVPYSTVWFRNFLHSKFFNQSVELNASLDIEHWQGILDITRTIFYLNYCINFFLYSVSGAYFRREMKRLFCVRSSGPLKNNKTERKQTFVSASANQSWV